MDVIDDIIEGAKTAAEKVGEVTETVVKKSKLFLDKSQLRSDLRNSYAKLGETIYKKRIAGEEFAGEDIDVCIEEIRYIKVSLESLDAEEETEGELRYCPDCHRVNSTDAAFCSGCGKKL